MLLGLHLLVGPLIDVGMGFDGFLAAFAAETQTLRLGFMGVYFIPPLPFSPLEVYPAESSFSNGVYADLLFLVRLTTWAAGVASVYIVWKKFEDLPGWRRLLYAYIIAALLSSFNPPVGFK